MIALIQSQIFILAGISCSGKCTSSSQQQTDGVKPPQPGLTHSQEEESACWRASNTTFIVPTENILHSPVGVPRTVASGSRIHTQADV